MRVAPRDPNRWETDPVRHYHVVFWRQPPAPSGVDQEKTGWHASENDVLEAADVHDAIAWADDESRKRTSMYALYAVVSVGELGEGLVWIAGVNPTRDGVYPNFERRQPPDVDPVGRTSS